MRARRTSPPPAARPQRLQSVDLLRGVAIGLMVFYHFCYDLGYYGFADFDFYDSPFWTSFRTLILSLFLGLVGVSLWLAQGRGVKWRKVLRRTALIAVNALLISAVTWQLFGERFIYFGVLHFIVVASLLGLLFLRFYRLNLVLGLALLALGAYSHPGFDPRAWNWIGFMTHKPATEDYVPLVPWFGVVLLGLFAARWLSRRGSLSAAREPAWVQRARLLPLAGRHSLLIYMLHQPLLMGVLGLFA
ncbi:MAG TPA: DUF1624 domain-containing protein [Gammaproteobacteria bacterium]|nr:DUF1624 domain-containing protein [Gammaproteobacteria bacterium]